MAKIKSYEFGPFCLDLRRRELLRNGERVRLRRKAYDLLEVLVQHHGQVVSKDVLISQLWPGAHAAENSLHVAIFAARKALDESAEDYQYILTASNGYSFVADVKEILEAEDGDEPVNSDLFDQLKISVNVNGSTVFLNQTLHIHISSALYGALAGVMVLVEVAYEFDKFFVLAAVLAPLAFCWAYISSTFILRAAERFVEQGRRDGLVRVIAMFIGAAIILYIGVSWFLPPVPVTRQAVAASTAQAAYLKAVVYHILMALPFLVAPFYFTLALLWELRRGEHRAVLRLLTGSRRSIPPQGTIYLRIWALALILGFYAAYAALAHHSLVGTLQPSPFKNIFIILLWVRLAIFLGFSTECLIWYYWALNEMKREIIAPNELRPVAASADLP